MNNKTLQAIAVVAAPLLTWLATDIVDEKATIGEDATKAVGATLAALVVFAMTQLFERPAEMVRLVSPAIRPACGFLRMVAAHPRWTRPGRSFFVSVYV